MKLIKTFLHGEIDADSLPDNHKKVWADVETYLATNPKYRNFTAWWRTRIQAVLPGYPRSISECQYWSRTALMRLCLDAELRLLIKGGECGEPGEECGWW